MHKTCANCGVGYETGPEPYQIDEWLCRECQRTPAVQVRVLFERARIQQFDFIRAWEFALGCAPGEEPGGRVRWPHDTDHRREWKAVFRDDTTIEVWRSAYLNQPTVKKFPIDMLVAA